MNKQTEIKLTIEGGGLSFKRSIDENTASRIISICMGSGNDAQDAMGVVQPASMNSGSPPKTAREYLLDYKPSNNQETILVLAYSRADVRKGDGFQQGDIKELFRETREKYSGNLSTDFNRLLRKGWIAERMKKDQALSKKPMYFITDTGRKALNNRFAKEAQPNSKPKKAVRRKKARVGK